MWSEIVTVAKIMTDKEQLLAVMKNPIYLDLFKFDEEGNLLGISEFFDYHINDVFDGYPISLIGPFTLTDGYMRLDKRVTRRPSIYKKAMDMFEQFKHKAASNVPKIKNIVNDITAMRGLEYSDPVLREFLDCLDSIFYAVERHHINKIVYTYNFVKEALCIIIKDEVRLEKALTHIDSHPASYIKTTSKFAQHYIVSDLVWEETFDFKTNEVHKKYLRDLVWNLRYRVPKEHQDQFDLTSMFVGYARMEDLN